MKAMGDLKQVADTIMRKLQDGSLPVRNDESPLSEDKTPLNFSPPPKFAPVERLTPGQAEHRRVIMMEVVQRYIFEKKLDALPDDVLRSTVKLYDEHFTYAGVPTNRIREVYLEAMRAHGPYLLKVDDYLRAWERIRPQEGAGADLRPMGERGQECALCGGTGLAIVFLPKEGVEIEKECPYHCKVVTTLQRKTA